MEERRRRRKRRGGGEEEKKIDNSKMDLGTMPALTHVLQQHTSYPVLTLLRGVGELERLLLFRVLGTLSEL